MNSIAMSESGQIIDPYNGVEDIKNKILRHTSDAFYEDPLRALRLARFKTKFTGFSIHEETAEVLSKILLSGEIDYLTKEDTGDRRELSGKITPNGIKSKLGSKRIEMDGFVDLAPLDLAVNSRFSLLFSATDNNNITGPNVGRSTKMLFRIVGEAELRTDLLRREKEQRQLITESIKKQDLILTDSGAIAAELIDIDELTRENKERMATLQKNQKNLGNDISNVVRALKGMVMEIKNNKLEEIMNSKKCTLRQPNTIFIII